MFVVDGIIARIEAEARQSRWRETGGLLFGYWTDDDDVVITEAYPSARGIRSSWRFSPDSDEDAQAIEAVVRRSKGAFTFLGDWHSHVFGGSKPSHRDYGAALSIAQTPEAYTPRPVVWVAGRAWPWSDEIDHGTYVLSVQSHLTRLTPRILASVPD